MVCRLHDPLYRLCAIHVSYIQYRTKQNKPVCDSTCDPRCARTVMFTDSAGTVGLLIKHTFSVNHVTCIKCTCKSAQLVCSKLCMQCCGNQIFHILYQWLATGQVHWMRHNFNWGRCNWCRSTFYQTVPWHLSIPEWSIEVPIASLQLKSTSVHYTLATYLLHNDLAAIKWRS